MTTTRIKAGATQVANVQRPTSNVQRPTKRKLESIAKRLGRAVKLSERIGKLCEQREELLVSAHAAGLALDTPIVLEDGKLWNLRKPEGKFVRFADLELKKVPTFSRQRDVASGPVESAAAGATA